MRVDVSVYIGGDDFATMLYRADQARYKCRVKNGDSVKSTVCQAVAAPPVAKRLCDAQKRTLAAVITRGTGMYTQMVEYHPTIINDSKYKKIP